MTTNLYEYSFAIKTSYKPDLRQFRYQISGNSLRWCGLLIEQACSKCKLTSCMRCLCLQYTRHYTPFVLALIYEHSHPYRVFESWPNRRLECRAVAVYIGKLDRKPPITDLSTSSNLGFPPIFASTIAKATATAAHFAKVPRSFDTLVVVELPAFWSSIVSPLLKLGSLTVIFDTCFISYGGYRKLNRYSNQPGTGTTGRLCVKASKPYLPW